MSKFFGYSDISIFRAERDRAKPKILNLKI